MIKKRQNLTICLVSKIKDFNGVWEVEVLINSKTYTYPINSEFALNKIESLLYRHKYGSVLKLLKLFKINNFNSFEKEIPV